MRGFALLAIGFAVSGAAPSPVQEYRFEAVTSKVMVVHQGTKRRAEAGDSAWAGDEVTTSWRGRATVGVPESAARFEVAPGSTVRLAGPEPGILVVLERGSLKAVFDALAGRRERLVATPGALLAVRGTRYAVRVDHDGNATLAVFSGRVDVMPRDPGLAPVSVTGGELCWFGPRRAPRRGPLPPTLDEGSWDRHGAMASGAPGGRWESPDGAPRAGGQQPRRGGGRGGG